MKTDIISSNINWTDVKNACRTTMNKDATDNKPNEKFKLDILISEHSPIRLLTVRWMWRIKSWVATHFARHWLGWDKFISTQRTDRVGINRDELPQGTEVTYDGNANTQALINVSKVRLCYKASKETREAMEELKYKIHEEVDENIANVMQRSCVYRCGCPEFEECGYWTKFKEKHSDIDFTNIRERYDAENKDFYERVNK